VPIRNLSGAQFLKYNFSKVRKDLLLSQGAIALTRFTGKVISTIKPR
jgi:hypothetical protein